MMAFQSLEAMSLPDVSLVLGMTSSPVGLKVWAGVQELRANCWVNEKSTCIWLREVRQANSITVYECDADCVSKDPSRLVLIMLEAIYGFIRNVKEVRMAIEVRGYKRMTQGFRIFQIFEGDEARKNANCPNDI